MPFKRLIDGYKSFYKDYFGSGNGMYEDLVQKGQSPETLVIACCDSRSDPAIITSGQPGEMYVVRNVAAIVPPYQRDNLHHGTSAAIEFAVRNIKVKHIVVMGHSQCGGVQALSARETIAQYEFLPQWVEIGKSALESVEQMLTAAAPDLERRALEQALVLVSLSNLMTFPWIAESVREGKINLHGWYFDMSSGKLLEYNPVTDHFDDIRKEKKASVTF